MTRRIQEISTAVRTDLVRNRSVADRIETGRRVAKRTEEIAGKIGRAVTGLPGMVGLALDTLRENRAKQKDAKIEVKNAWSGVVETALRQDSRVVKAIDESDKKQSALELELGITGENINKILAIIRYSSQGEGYEFNFTDGIRFVSSGHDGDFRCGLYTAPHFTEQGKVGEVFVDNKNGLRDALTIQTTIALPATIQAPTNKDILSMPVLTDGVVKEYIQNIHSRDMHNQTAFAFWGGLTPESKAHVAVVYQRGYDSWR